MLFGNRARHTPLALVQIPERLARMHPARSLDEVAVCIELGKAGIRIGLQNTFEVLKVRLGMFALAVARVAQPRRRRDARQCAIVAHVYPQPPGLGLAPPGREHRHVRDVGVELL